TGSGVMVTGSHNGPEYNGLKILLGGETLAGDAIQSIRKRIEAGEISTGQGELQTADLTADYIRRASEDIPVALGGAFKLVIDCGNGVAGQIAPQLYRALGHDVVELYCDVDGKFPNHHPDPSQPENLQALITRVREEKADLGFAFDGDGDRLGVVDSEGNIIWPDRQLMLLAKDVLSRNQGMPVIFDVKCSRYLKAIIELSGGKPLMWKTGHSLIKAKMKEINAPLAGEMSGHIFFKERWYGFDDAVYTGARLLEILTKSRKKPAEVFAELPGGMATPELRIPLAEKYHAKFMQAMLKKMSFADAEITDIDGLRVDFSDGWGLVRPSNTSPCLVARFEAEDEKALARIQSEFRGLIQSITPDLKLPF
ncbi:MAG: phosphomannomutase/phosphoglucomutase, partial [Gammaproteobacteria bacterium]|nr:phosphomannomutase/phosphoglucomutase [Gammaproteobacteria bacterium]